MTADSRPLVTDLAALESTARPAGYEEFLRVPAMSMGLFIASAGYHDTQQPHAEDEVYVVVAGSAVLEIDGVDRPVRAGSIAYIPRCVPHHFHDISDDLRVLVVFAPAET